MTIRYRQCTLDGMTIKVPVCKCKVSGYEWVPRKPELPLRCAGCQSPYWRREPKKKSQE